MASRHERLLGPARACGTGPKAMRACLAWLGRIDASYRGPQTGMRA